MAAQPSARPPSGDGSTRGCAPAVRGIGDRLDDLIGFLGTRPFFYSNQVSMADLSVYAMLYSLSLEVIPGSKALVVNRTPLLDFMRRVESVTGDQAESP